MIFNKTLKQELGPQTPRYKLNIYKSSKPLKQNNQILSKEPTSSSSSTMPQEQIPLALLVLNIPHSLLRLLIKLISTVTFGPFNLCMKLSRGVLFHQNFYIDSNTFYFTYWLPRTLLTLLNMALLIFAVGSPFYTFFMLKELDLTLTNQIISYVTLFGLGLYLWKQQLGNEEKRQSYRALFTIFLYIFQDLVSAVLAMITLCCIVRAPKVFKYTPEKDERGFFNHITYEFFLSLADLMFVGCKIMILYVIPIRRKHFLDLRDSKEADFFDEKLLLLSESIYTFFDLLTIIVALVFFTLNSLMLPVVSHKLMITIMRKLPTQSVTLGLVMAMGHLMKLNFNLISFFIMNFWNLPQNFKKWKLCMRGLSDLSQDIVPQNDQQDANYRIRTIVKDKINGIITDHLDQSAGKVLRFFQSILAIVIVPWRLFYAVKLYRMQKNGRLARIMKSPYQLNYQRFQRRRRQNQQDDNLEQQELDRVTNVISQKQLLDIWFVEFMGMQLGYCFRDYLLILLAALHLVLGFPASWNILLLLKHNYSEVQFQDLHNRDCFKAAISTLNPKFWILFYPSWIFLAIQVAMNYYRLPQVFSLAYKLFFKVNSTFNFNGNQEAYTNEVHFMKRYYDYLMMLNTYTKEASNQSEFWADYQKIPQKPSSLVTSIEKILKEERFSPVMATNRLLTQMAAFKQKFYLTNYKQFGLNQERLQQWEEVLPILEEELSNIDESRNKMMFDVLQNLKDLSENQKQYQKALAAIKYYDPLYFDFEDQKLQTRIIGETNQAESAIAIRIEWSLANHMSQVYDSRRSSANSCIYFSLLLLWRTPLYYMIFMNEDFKLAVLGENYANRRALRNISVVIIFIWKQLYRDIVYYCYYPILYLNYSNMAYVVNKAKPGFERPRDAIELMTYLKKPKSVIKEYALYILDEYLQNIVKFLSKIALHRKQTIVKIQNLSKIPQRENITKQNGNVFVLLELIYDIPVLLTVLAIMIFLPYRTFYSLSLIYRKYLIRELNPVIKFDQHERIERIKKEFYQRRIKVLKQLLFKIILQDLLILASMALMVLTVYKIPFVVSYLYQKGQKHYDLLRTSYKNKEKVNRDISQGILEPVLDEERDLAKEEEQEAQRMDETAGNQPAGNRQRVIPDHRLRVRIGNKIKEYFKGFSDSQLQIFLLEFKEMADDLLCFVSFLIILSGFYQVPRMTKRLCRMLTYDIKNSKIYKKLTQRKRSSDKMETQPLLHDLNWVGIQRVSEFLTIKDRLEITQVNSQSREYFFKNSFVWMDYYKKNIDASIDSIKDFENVGKQCIAHFKLQNQKEVSEWELDLQYGYRWIFKEEVLVTMIELPNLILLPMKLVGKVLQKTKIDFVEPNTMLATRNTEVQREWDDIERTGILQFARQRATQRRVRITNHFKTQHQLIPLSQPVHNKKVLTEEDIQPILALKRLEMFFTKTFLWGTEMWVVFRSMLVYNIEAQIRSKNPLRNFQAWVLSFGNWIYIGILALAAWKMFFFYRSLNYSLVHIFVGPLGFHIWIIGNYLFQVRLMSDQEDVALTKSLWTFGLPFRMIYNFVKMIGNDEVKNEFKTDINNAYTYIKDDVFGQVRFIFDWLEGLNSLIFGKYAVPLEIASRKMLNKGRGMELVHLVFTIAWMGWPLLVAWVVNKSSVWITASIIVAILMIHAVGVIDACVLKKNQ